METTAQANEADIKTKDGGGWRILFRCLLIVAIVVVPFLWYDNRRLYTLNAQLQTDRRNEIIECEQRVSRAVLSERDKGDIKLQEAQDKFEDFITHRLSLAKKVNKLLKK